VVPRGSDGSGSTAPERLVWHQACAIKNQATAGLYYYTPYTPNDIALVNLASVGDSCSAYGNRNFWRVYNYWFNPTKDFRTMATTRNGVTMVVDRDGTIATSSNLTSWQRIGVAPGSSGSNRVSEFGQTSGGNYAILMADGTAFESSDGVAWNPLTVQATEVNQDIVTRHTVKSGDTVWAISRANGVSVSAVVAENSLPRGGALIRVGQVLTITKKGVVRTVDSPVILDPSIVIAAGSTRDADADNAPVTSRRLPLKAKARKPRPRRIQRMSTESSEETPSESTEDTSDTPLPALEPIVSQTQTNDVFYTVARGDTLIRIAFRNNTTVSKLVADNGIRNRNRIIIGQRLKVGVSETTMTYHRGQEGDTLTRISERRSVPLDRLLTLNTDRTATSAIAVGDLIRLS
jgi:LysM repeat protein